MKISSYFIDIRSQYIMILTLWYDHNYAFNKMKFKFKNFVSIVFCWKIISKEMIFLHEPRNYYLLKNQFSIKYDLLKFRFIKFAFQRQQFNLWVLFDFSSQRNSPKSFYFYWLKIRKQTLYSDSIFFKPDQISYY